MRLSGRLRLRRTLVRGILVRRGRLLTVLVLLHSLGEWGRIQTWLVLVLWIVGSAIPVTVRWIVRSVSSGLVSLTFLWGFALGPLGLLVLGFTIRLGALVAVLLVAIGNVLPDAGAGLQLLEELGQCGSRGRFGNVTPEIWLKPGLNHCDLVEYIINLGSAGMTNNILCKGARGPVIPNIVVSIRKGL